MRGALGRLVLLAVVVGAWLLAASLPAVGHSFLAETRPAQGTRLVTPPEEVAIQLSEPVVPESVSIEVRGSSEAQIEVGRPEIASDGRVVRLPLVDPPVDVLSVSWEVTSAVDGHSSAGEFSFAAGDVAAELRAAPSTPSTTGPPSVLDAVATWLFYVGLSVAGATWLLLGPIGHDVSAAFPGTAQAWLRIGGGVASLGLLVRAVSGGSATASLGPGGLAAAGLLAVALLLSRWGPVWPSSVAIATAAVSWAARGHGATLHGTLGWLLDATHIVAASLWVGGLLAVVVAMLRRRLGADQASVLPLVRRYGAGAAVAVAVLVVSGVASATLLVPGWSEVLATGYGRLLTAKSVLVVVAVGLAVAARLWLLPAGRTIPLRWLTRPELGVLAAALAIAAVLIEVAPPEPRLDTDWLLGAPPMEGRVGRAADVAGHMMIDVQAGEGRLDVNVRGPSGGIDADLDLTARLPGGREVELHPRPCGVGCFTQPFDPPSGETLLAVEAHAEGWRGGSAELELTWPPVPEEPERFERMRRAMLDVEGLTVAESSDEYPADASEGFEIDGEGFTELMPWAGGGVTAVRGVPGEPERFTFYLSGSTMWFDVTVDERGRLVTQRLVNPGHDIRYRFAYPPATPDEEET
jgi:copper transport protein